MLDLGGHVGHGHGVEPAQAAQLACGIAQAVEDHRPNERLDIQLALARSHGAPKGAVETKVFPQFVQRENISKRFGGCVRDLWCFWFVTPCHAAQASDQRIEMAILHSVDPAKVSNNPMARLTRLVAIRLDELQVAPFTAFADPNKHAYRIFSTIKQSKRF